MIYNRKSTVNSTAQKRHILKDKLPAAGDLLEGFMDSAKHVRLKPFGLFLERGLARIRSLDRALSTLSKHQESRRQQQTDTKFSVWWLTATGEPNMDADIDICIYIYI